MTSRGVWSRGGALEHEAPAAMIGHPHRQLSLRKLFLLVLVYAVFFGLAAGVSLPVREVLAAALVTTFFVLCDLRFAPVERQAASGWEKRIAFVAYYATAFAWSAAACLPVFLFYLPITWNSFRLLRRRRRDRQKHSPT
jgi:hypothetical protein